MIIDFFIKMWYFCNIQIVIKQINKLQVGLQLITLNF